MSTLLCLALTGNYSQHNTHQSQTPATCTTELNNSQLLDVVDDSLKALHPRRPWGSASEYIVTSHINCILQMFFLFNTDFTIFTVPKRSIRWHFSIVSLMFITPIFSIFFRKLDGASPVAPQTICIISNVKLGYNLFSSDDNCILLSYFKLMFFLTLISRPIAMSIM